MTQSVPVVAQLGASYSGDTISFKIFNQDGTQYANWTSIGFSEIGSTGTFLKANVTAPDEGGYIQFSNDGGSTVIGAVAEIEPSGITETRIRSAVGMATANLDTQLDAIPTAAENRAEIDSNSTQLAMILADTNELQANQGNWLTATGFATSSELSIHDDKLDNVLNVLNTTGVSISVSTMQTIADEILKRSVSGVEDDADTTSLAAVILAILESSRSNTTWTIRKTDGSDFVIKTLTLENNAKPVTGVT